MAEFICWEPQGGQRLITPHRAGPLFFFLSRAVCLRGLCSIHYGFTLDRRGNPISIYCVCGAYLAIDLKTDRPVACGIKHEEKNIHSYITPYTRLCDSNLVS